MNDSFIFYRSFFEAVKRVPKGQREELYEAIIDFALNNEEYTGDNYIAKMVLDFVKPQIKANEERRINGSKGGRPKKNPTGDIGKKPMVIENAETKKPMVIENAETKKPNVNDNVECLNDNVECLKENISINRDKKETKTKFNFKDALMKLGVPPEYVDEWLVIRKSKKAVNTEMALKVLTDEANKAGIMVAEAVKMCCENQWRGFKAEYYYNRLKDSNGIKVEHGRLRSTEEMRRIVECGQKLYEQSLN